MEETQSETLNKPQNGFFSLLNSFDFGVLLSIVLGVIGIILSAYILNINIEPKKENFQIFLSNHTSKVIGNNGDRDTLFVGANHLYREYLDSINRHQQVKLYDPKLHSIKFDYVASQDKFVISFDTTCHPYHEKAYFKESKILYKKIYYSNNAVVLNNLIDSLDSHYLAKLEKVSNEENLFMNHNPKVLVWILLISIAIGFSFFLIPILLFQINHYKKGVDSWRWVINISVAAFLIFILLGSLIVDKDSSLAKLIRPLDFVPIFNLGIKSFGLYYSASVPFVGPFIWLILVFTLNSKLSFWSRNTELFNALEFKKLKKDFESYFIVIAIFLGYTIFCTGSLINVLNSLIGAEGEYPLLPKEFTIVNGILQTFFLLILYVSMQSHIKKVEELDLNKELSTNDESSSKALKGKSPWHYLKVVLTMFAPIIGGGFQEIITLIIS